MAFYKSWQVLAVDDEPDVLAVTSLSMRNFEVYGLPIQVHAAAGKAEAIDYLKSEPAVVPSLNVAFIDVVMETETAGLELCQYIRNDLDNHVTQLYIRTGQPGIAPEREVIDLYDINGYFTKVEATENKLYSLVTSGVRQSYSIRWSKIVMTMLDDIIAGAESREKITANLQQIFRSMAGESALHIEASMEIDGQRIAISDLDAAHETKVKRRVENRDSKPLGRDGDRYYVDEHNWHLVVVASGPDHPEISFLFRAMHSVPDNVIYKMQYFLKATATLWALRATRA